jgi:hypothetical protein
MLWNSLRYGWGNTAAIFALALVPPLTVGNVILEYVSSHQFSVQANDPINVVKGTDEKTAPEPLVVVFYV